MLNSSIRQKLAPYVEGEIRELHPLSGGCVGEVYGFAAGDADYVVKVDAGRSGTLAVEGRMLDYLAAHTGLPVPRPLGYDESFLLMPRLPGGPAFNHSAEMHAADVLAALHAVHGQAYGFDFDTVIGGLPQPNAWSGQWLSFFAERRLLEMARQAHGAGNLPLELMRPLEQAAQNLSRWLDEPQGPALIHGDVWSGNVLAQHGHITGFLDPAIYFADSEIELAFITMFSTFGDSFFRRYAEHRAISQDFWEIKRDIYNLYPYLVHVRLFGGGYVNSVAEILRRITHGHL